MDFALYDQFPSTEILAYRSFWDAAVVTDEMSGGWGDVVVEEVRREFTIKRVFRMNEHVRLWESCRLGFH